MEWFLTLGFKPCEWIWDHIANMYLSFTTFGITLAIMVALAAYAVAKEGPPSDPSDYGPMIFIMLLGAVVIPLGIGFAIAIALCAIIGLLPLSLLISLAAGIGWTAFHKDKAIALAEKIYKELSK